ncbi:MAG: Na/Pi cotransporter family protein [Candidatus Spyradocola sp.]
MTWQDFVLLGGGLGLFLFGMKLMGDELERAAGNSLRHLLEVLTRNRIMGLLMGMLFTMLVQSSSATTVMVVGFVNAGLMDLYQAAGVIFGSNIGSTITAQLIAFKLTDIAPAFVLVGMILYSFGKKASLRQVGGVLLGFGVLFVGLDLMGDSVSKLRDMPEVASIMASFAQTPILGILAGLVITAVIQSSAASVGILQLLASQGLIGLDAAVYVVMGQNIGTCATALLASIGSNKNARRTAVLHVLFNVLGTLVFYFVVQLIPVTDWVASLTPGDPMRQIANMHLLFNVFGVALFFPFINQLVALVNKLVPGEDPAANAKRLQYLNQNILKTPPVALNHAIMECKRMQQLANDNIELAMQCFLAGKATESQQAELAEREDVINFLNHEITKYLVLINQTELSEHEGVLVGELFHVVNDIERIGDHAENIIEYAMSRESGKFTLSDAAQLELREMFTSVHDLLNMALIAFDTHDENRIVRAYALEARVDDMADLLHDRHIERLTRGLCTPNSGMLFSDTVSNLERVADHAINIINSADMD